MLEIIVASLFIATSINLLFKKWGLPTILGYISTGAIISHLFYIDKHTNNHELHTLAEFGIVFLMFTIGLEFSLSQLQKMKKEVFVFGGLQVAITTFVFSIILHYLLNIALTQAIVIGSALSLASTAIVLKMFTDSGEISRPHGKNVVGILLFQDIAVIPILLFITILSVQNQDITYLVSKTIMSAIALLVIILLVGKKLLNPFFSRVFEANTQEIFISSVLFIVLLSSYLSYLFGFSYSLGAFIAGILIAETHYKHQVESDLVPFREILLGIFFITVGMQLDFNIINENKLFIVLMLIAIISVKFLVIFAILYKFHNLRTVLKSSIALFGLGEFSLVIFGMAEQNKLISSDLNQIMITTVVLSLILTPLFVKNIADIVDYISRIDPDKYPKMAIQEEHNNHIIVIGFGRLGEYITKYLKENNISYVVIESDYKRFSYGQKNNEPIILGNANQKHILEAAGIKKAAAVLISIGKNKKLHELCAIIQTENNHINIVVKTHSNEEKTLLEDLNLSHVIVETEETAIQMTQHVKDKYK